MTVNFKYMYHDIYVVNWIENGGRRCRPSKVCVDQLFQVSSKNTTERGVLHFNVYLYVNM